MPPLQYAIRSLLRKRQTEKQIREKLKKRFPEANADEVILRLKELNYINDEEFSQAWVRHRSLGAPRGKFKLDLELKTKGVSAQNRENALKEFEEEEVLMELAQKKWQKLKHGKKSSEKLMRFLLSRGFAISSVIKIVKSFAREED